ncbi:hypothetical protein SteCoe_6782 [Stentor coeruleus]|uniref:Protein kinase domain-containing protein n=1 Tax=Stentor coeruleus TaxID=5963 RepID=A0A1R2CP88_9CILI|nr:hypothetical protein SteCoe_6782 [Stentor coeruleus]
MSKKYELTGMLGRGSSSKVYLSTNTQTGKNFAIKKIDLSTTQIEEKHLKREIDCLIQFKNHNNIVKLEEWFYEDNFLYIVQEYCNGGSLKNFLKRANNIPDNLKMFWINDIAQSIKLLHDNGWVHRDIKSDNFLLNSLDIKLCDFGLSRKTNENEYDYTICGTPLYMSPDLLNNNFSGQKDDIWSFGVLCYEIISGKLPFQAKDFKGLVVLLNEEIDYTKFSEPAANFLRKALEKDPRKRATIHDLIQDDFITSFFIGIINQVIKLLKYCDNSDDLFYIRLKLVLCYFIKFELRDKNCDSKTSQHDIDQLYYDNIIKNLLEMLNSNFNQDLYEQCLCDLQDEIKNVAIHNPYRASLLLYVYKSLNRPIFKKQHVN